ncbi:type II toxin-antitoxin system RelE/ParE family toxin [Mucilaginibacter sp. UYCu711]|uniref:type II toxin-antitoxin system RelE/ParE family toxin n=1 Tax=Mucilaginibacter sp. UYCu711 TaxID=3156339 RepID=UPI003D1F87F4
MLGKELEDLNNDSFRELILQNYRIIYEVLSDTQISILTIHHNARSITNNPAFTDED